MADRMKRLYDAVYARRHLSSDESRTAKLLQSGTGKVAKKLCEEAAEVAIDAARGERAGVIVESADLLYQLTVLLVHQRIPLESVWAELDRREKMLGIAEKLPKTSERGKVVPLGRVRRA